MLSEKIIQAKILRWLRQRPNSYTIKLSELWLVGVPDIFHIEDTVFYAFEVKTSTGKATKLQLHTLKQLEKAGAQCSIVRSLKDVISIVSPGTTTS